MQKNADFRAVPLFRQQSMCRERIEPMVKSIIDVINIIITILKGCLGMAKMAGRPILRIFAVEKC